MDLYRTRTYLSPDLSPLDGIFWDLKYGGRGEATPRENLDASRITFVISALLDLERRSRLRLEECRIDEQFCTSLSPLRGP